MKSAFKTSKPRARRRDRDPKICSTVQLVVCLLILCWVGFLSFCWKSGRLRAIDGMINAAEVNIRGSLSKLHIADPLVVPKDGAGAIAAVHNEIEVEELGDIHVIFSTDCSPYQDWQTLVVFHSALTAGQEGPVTRIASGCNEEKKKTLTDLYLKLYPKYHVHFTPDFKKDAKTEKSCK